MKSDDKVERLMLPKPRSFIEELLGGSMVSSQAPAMSTVKGAFGEVLLQIQKAEDFARLFSEPAVLVMPYEIRIK
jgi:hypothetical protein